MEISQKEQAPGGLEITPEEINRRLSFPYEKIGITFEDLTCNRMVFFLPGGRYRQKTFLKKDYQNDLYFNQTFYWNDLDASLLSSEIQKYEESGNFKEVRDEIKEKLGNEIKIDLYHQTGDYSLQEEESLVMSLGEGIKRTFLKIDYPLYSDGIGTININFKPDNENLETDLEKIFTTLHVLSDHALIPKITGILSDITYRFDDVLDETGVISKYEKLKNNLDQYKLLFDRDLNNIKNIEAEHGLHRAIVYFLGTEVGLMFLQNTDLKANQALSNHEAVLNSWLKDPHRKNLIEDTGFSTDNMSNYMHTFVSFEDRKTIWIIDRGGGVPDWARSSKLDEEYITEYLSKRYGISDERGEISKEVSEELARSGMLKPEINSNFKLLKTEYGSLFAKRYELLAEKFLIKGGKEFDPGWDEFQAIQKLLSRVLDTHSK